MPASWLRRRHGASWRVTVFVRTSIRFLIHDWDNDLSDCQDGTTYDNILSIELPVPAAAAVSGALLPRICAGHRCHQRRPGPRGQLHGRALHPPDSGGQEGGAQLSACMSSNI